MKKPRRFTGIFKQSVKFLAGCRSVGGEPVAKIAAENGMSRTYVYQQKEKVVRHAEGLDSKEPDAPTLVLDKNTIDRMILSLTFDCQSPNSGIVRFFETVIKVKTVSAGYISGLLSEATECAKTFDAQIVLSGISQGAHDEIFQCGTPILTGIDPESTYTYLLEEVENRTADTWEMQLEDCKDHGLDLKVSINDCGTGLMAGMSRAYPDAEIQSDTFHAIYSMGKEVSKLERKANGMIKKEAGLLENLASKKPRVKNKAKLSELRPKMTEAINHYDTVAILFTWLKELLNFSGYCLEETFVLATWVLNEIRDISQENAKLLAELAKVQKMLPSLLSFVGRLEREMAKVGEETGIPSEAFTLMYRQMSHAPGSEKEINLQCKIALLLGDKYAQAKCEFDRLLRKTKKASSMVENLNGRIRVFVEVKRVIPTSFFPLLKVYYNTRRYSRSRYKERVGKSPYELLTGRTQPEFLEALGF